MPHVQIRRSHRKAGLEKMIDTQQETISRVKEAEEKAREILKAAREQSQKMILDAKFDAKELLNRRETEARAAAKAIAEKARSAMAREVEKVWQNTKEEKDALDAKAASRLDRTSAFIVEKALHAYGGRTTQ